VLDHLAGILKFFRTADREVATLDCQGVG
jgi:hypothetical protein